MYRCLGLLIGGLMMTRSALAIDLYVDNVSGRDENDGTVARAVENFVGPVRTLNRAAELAQFGDVINLKNNGVPYYDSLSLTGKRHSGTTFTPFVVNGNGATISGLRSVPPQGWYEVTAEVWRLTPTRKGYYQLLREGKLLPEYIPPNNSKPFDQLPKGHWVSWRGSLYYRQDSVAPPHRESFQFAADQTGISLQKVKNVLIRNVRLQHFRFDGIHAQGICRHVELENVVAVENGRAGVVASQASSLFLIGGRVARNGRHEILTSDTSSATLMTDSPAEQSEPQSEETVNGQEQENSKE